MRKVFAILALLFLSGSAVAFPASLDVVDRSASPEDPAIFEVNMTNDLDRSALFELGTFSPKPSWVYTEGSRSLEPGESGIFRITVTPGELAVDQSYSFRIYARSSAVQESRTFRTSFDVDRDREIILEDMNLNRTAYDPGETVKGEVKIRSISSRVLKEYEVKASYENLSTTKTSSPILPGGTRTLRFKLPVAENASPAEHRVRTVLNLGEEKVEEALANFTVGEVVSIIRDTTGTNNLATKTGTVMVENRGNAPVNYTVNRSVPSYLTPITRFTKQPTNVQSKGSTRHYFFTTELHPGGTYTVKRTTNYWIPATALLGIIIALAGLKKLRNTVKIQKKAEKTSSGLKISIEIENISDRIFMDVTVEDFVPDIAEVDKNFEMASPTLRKTNEGTKLTWDLEDLEPGDQRVLQYTIRPKVEVEGGVELQKAELREEDQTIKKTDSFNAEFSP
jgi:hypothetical protein